ncbi:PTS sugar transporter subunit IIA [Neorhizobium alkalisoli]|uniref:Phosphotransferase IIA-like nitrogen-regulatory protein PtsN n=1 Tax=Neorhizobium alkalisoli TaxID=528178 RepID=A0A561QSS2_9HYPH|nr:PTS sugar transporter subunit IIA [Neorhizobium alkalisoli]TWF53438.1 phosphotransferase IIA-like nitrogen-regulatory protein PtsN [Neorhizobium alkalisoli]
MKLADCLLPENIVLDLAAPSKQALIGKLSALAARRLGLEESEIARALTARENLGSTGIGGGVAIPHAAVMGLDRHFCLFARLSRPVDFEAVDEKPVDLVFLLLNPQRQPDHLNILSCIARRMRNDEIVAAIRAAASPDEVYLRICPTDVERN